MATEATTLETAAAGYRAAPAQQRDRVAENLACVELHFHSEAQDVIEAARRRPSRTPRKSGGRRA